MPLPEFEGKPNISQAELVERKNFARKREKELYGRAVKAVMEAGPEFKDAIMGSDWSQIVQFLYIKSGDKLCCSVLHSDGLRTVTRW